MGNSLTLHYIIQTTILIYPFAIGRSYIKVLSQRIKIGRLRFFQWDSFNGSGDCVHGTRSLPVFVSFFLSKSELRLSSQIGWNVQTIISLYCPFNILKIATVRFKHHSLNNNVYNIRHTMYIVRSMPNNMYCT